MNNSSFYSFEILSQTFVLQKEGINMGLLLGTRTLAGSAMFFLSCPYYTNDRNCLPD